jgi:hypothetical protein
LTIGIARYLIGIACIAVAFTPIAFGTRAVRRRFLPSLSGPPAALAEIVIGLSFVVCISELLGTIGLFRIAPVVVAFAASGFGAWRLARRPGPDETPGSVPGVHDSAVATPFARWQHAAAIVAVAVVFAEWSTRVADSLQRGMAGTADTLWYHMPVAARFFQTGWTPWLHFSDGNSLTAFYPANSELVHALGIVFMGRDVLSPLLNLFWLSLALLAAWCIGRPFGVAPLSMIGAAVLLATPELVLDDAGSALNDVVSIALLMAAVALIVNGRRRDGPGTESGVFVVAALAAGLGLGTKYTLIPAVGILTIGVFVLQRRGTRGRRSGQWLAALALTGAYWYVRNLVATGNPLPTLSIGVGPLKLPSIPFPGASKVSDYLFDSHAWSTYLLPGLRAAFGPAWWAVFAIALVGAALTLVLIRRPVVRVVAALSLLSFVAFLVSPQILGLGKMPVYFVVNARYAAPALILGIAIVPVGVARFGRAALMALLAVFGFILAATQFDRGLWRNLGTHIAQPTTVSSARPWGITVGIAIAAVGLAWRFGRDKVRLTRPVALRGACALLAVVVVGGYLLEKSYLSDRYRHGPALAGINDRVLGFHDQRIAIVGFFTQYPLVGADLSNYVQYVAHRSGDKRSSRILDCADWRRAINDGRYDYVIATNPGFPFPTKAPALEVGWTGSDPAAKLIDNETINGARAWLFEINGKLHPDSCPPTPAPARSGK